MTKMDAFVVAVGTDEDIVYSKSTSVQVIISLSLNNYSINEYKGPIILISGYTDDPYNQTHKILSHYTDGFLTDRSGYTDCTDWQFEAVRITKSSSCLNGPKLPLLL